MPGPYNLSRGLRLALCAGVLANEALDEVASALVLDLLRGRLHQVSARGFERAGQPVQESELREPNGVDHDPCRVGRIPDLQLELEVERRVSERRAFEADVGP